MPDVYRVSIVHETGSGADLDSETIFEVAGGIGMVARIAPGALVDALRAANEEGAGDLAERVMDAAGAAGAPVAPATHPFSGDQQPKQRRPRRTKAEIAADNEAQTLGFRDAAHRAESEPQRLAAADVKEEQSTKPQDGPAEVSNVIPLTGGIAPSPTMPAPPAGGTYNPFAPGLTTKA